MHIDEHIHCHPIAVEDPSFLTSPKMVKVKATTWAVRLEHNDSSTGCANESIGEVQLQELNTLRSEGEILSSTCFGLVNG